MGEHVKANMWCERCGPVTGVEHRHLFRGSDYRCQTCGGPVRQKSPDDALSPSAVSAGAFGTDATSFATSVSPGPATSVSPSPSASDPGPLLTGPGVDLILTSAGDKKIQVIKVIREHTKLGLKQAKELADRVPSQLLRGADPATADAFRRDIEAAGGSVQVRSPDGAHATAGAAKTIKPHGEALIDTLERLAALHDRGALTDEEFEEAKEDVITRPAE